MGINIPQFKFYYLEITLIIKKIKWSFWHSLDANNCQIFKIGNQAIQSL